MPRIDAMAREHSGTNVSVIGVATLPQEGMKPTREFLASRAEPLAYAVAEDQDNRLAALYDVLNLGLPTVAIVDAQGRLAWIATGSDAPVEETLRAILAGEHDLAAAAEADRRLLALRAEGDRLLAAARALFNEGRIDESVPIYEQVIALDPREYGYVAGRVFTKFRNAGRADLALSLGRRAQAGPIAGEPDALEGLADDALSGDTPSPDEIALALAAAARAGDLTQWREPDA
jgi:tetratricopeptide (TPR) repeat protein